MLSQWFNVNKDSRIWAGHSDTHKQGWIYAPAAILAIEEYKGSYRFEEWKIEGEGRGAFSATSGYPSFWIRMEDVSILPFEGPNGDPDPTPDPDPDEYPDKVSDAKLGAALRTLVNFIRRGW